MGYILKSLQLSREEYAIFSGLIIFSTGLSFHKMLTVGANTCKHDKFITAPLRAFIFLLHVHDTNLKVKYDIQ